jgi:hypothetical protein
LQNRDTLGQSAGLDVAGLKDHGSRDLTCCSKYGSAIFNGVPLERLVRDHFAAEAGSAAPPRRLQPKHRPAPLALSSCPQHSPQDEAASSS